MRRFAFFVTLTFLLGACGQNADDSGGNQSDNQQPDNEKPRDSADYDKIGPVAESFKKLQGTWQQTNSSQTKTVNGPVTYQQKWVLLNDREILVEYDCSLRKVTQDGVKEVKGAGKQELYVNSATKSSFILDKKPGVHCNFPGGEAVKYNDGLREIQYSQVQDSAMDQALSLEIKEGKTSEFLKQ